MIETMMTCRLGRKWMIPLVCLLAMAGVPSGAHAQENELDHDARLEGYKEPIALEESNMAMTWVGFGLVSIIALLGMFKDAKRTHLD